MGMRRAAATLSKPKIFRRGNKNVTFPPEPPTNSSRPQKPSPPRWRRQLPRTPWTVHLLPNYLRDYNIILNININNIKITYNIFTLQSRIIIIHNMYYYEICSATPCNIIVQFKFPFEHASKMRIGFASFRSTNAYRIVVVVLNTFPRKTKMCSVWRAWRVYGDLIKNNNLLQL